MNVVNDVDQAKELQYEPRQEKRATKEGYATGQAEAKSIARLLTCVRVPHKSIMVFLNTSQKHSMLIPKCIQYSSFQVNLMPFKKSAIQSV